MFTVFNRLSRLPATAIVGPGRRWAIGALAMAMMLLTGGGPTPDIQPPRLPVMDFADREPLRVLSVPAGDVVIVEAGGVRTKYRLLGIRPPSSASPRADDTRRFLDNLLRGESVYLEQEVPDPDAGGEAAEEPDAPAVTPSPDSHSATGAYVFRAPDGLFVNLELVRQGYVRADSQGALRYGELFAYYDASARKHRRGNWAPRARRLEPRDRDSEESARRASARPTRERTTEAKKTESATMVYITPSGQCYHKKDCSHLHGSELTITLDEAKKRGLRPCSRCEPPE